MTNSQGSDTPVTRVLKELQGRIRYSATKDIEARIKTLQNESLEASPKKSTIANVLNGTNVKKVNVMRVGEALASMIAPTDREEQARLIGRVEAAFSELTAPIPPAPLKAEPRHEWGTDVSVHALSAALHWGSGLPDGPETGRHIAATLTLRSSEAPDQNRGMLTAAFGQWVGFEFWETSALYRHGASQEFRQDAGQGWVAYWGPMTRNSDGRMLALLGLRFDIAGSLAVYIRDADAAQVRVPPTKAVALAAALSLAAALEWTGPADIRLFDVEPEDSVSSSLGRAIRMLQFGPSFEGATVTVEPRGRRDTQGVRRLFGVDAAIDVLWPQLGDAERAEFKETVGEFSNNSDHDVPAETSWFKRARKQ